MRCERKCWASATVCGRGVDLRERRRLSKHMYALRVGEIGIGRSPLLISISTKVRPTFRPVPPPCIEFHLVVSVRDADHQRPAVPSDTPGTHHFENVPPKVESVPVPAKTGMLQGRKRHDGIEQFKRTVDVPQPIFQRCQSLDLLVFALDGCELQTHHRSGAGLENAGLHPRIFGANDAHAPSLHPIGDDAQRLSQSVGLV